MIALFAQGGDWSDILGNLFPYLIVVLVGLLTIVKRLIERFVLKREPTPAEGAEGDGDAAEAGDAPAPTSVMDEIKRYIDVIEGRTESGPTVAEAPPPETEDDAEATVAPPAPPAEPSRPREARSPRRRRRRLAAPLIDQPTDVSVSHRDLTFDAAALRRAIEFTHSELLEGSAAVTRRRRGLPQVRLRRSPTAVREAFLWREILAPPPGLRPPPGAENEPDSGRSGHF